MQFGELELADQVGLRRLYSAAATDSVDHLVYDIQRLEQALDDVKPCLPFGQFVATAPDDDVQPVFDEIDQHFLQGEPLRPHQRIAVDLFGDQSQSVDAKGLAQLAAGQDSLQYLAGVGHAADLDHRPHALVV